MNDSILSALADAIMSLHGVIVVSREQRHPCAVTGSGVLGSPSLAIDPLRAAIALSLCHALAALEPPDALRILPILPQLEMILGIHRSAALRQQDRRAMATNSRVRAQAVRAVDGAAAADLTTLNEATLLDTSLTINYLSASHGDCAAGGSTQATFGSRLSGDRHPAWQVSPPQRAVLPTTTPTVGFPRLLI